MQFRFACFSAGMMGLASLLLGPGCAEGEEITTRSGTAGNVGSGGAAGSSGAAGSNGTGTGGSGGTGATGSGGTGGSGAIGGGGGSGGAGGGAGKGGSGGAGKGGSGGATGGTGGATGGSGGSTGGTGGTGGATGGSGGSTTGGTGGATGGSGGATGGSGGTAGVGGSAGAGGSLDGGGSCPAGVSYCADFDRDAAGAMPAGWTRVGGSDGDWQVFFVDGSNTFAQNHASSSTFRLCYPSTAPALSGPTTVSARVKILLSGSSGTTTALLCMGYRTGSGSNYACLTLEQGAGLRIRMNAASSPTDGPLWPVPIAVGTWYDVKISMDAAGALTAYLGGALLGTYMPASALAGGSVAVATQSAHAAFDTVIVTQP